MGSSRWWRGGLIALGIILVTSSIRAQDHRVLRVGHEEPGTLNPHMALTGASQGIVRFLYRGLARFAIGEKGVNTAEATPDLAESWTAPLHGGLTWVIQLRQGVQFHKGFGEMTAEDVKFSFDYQIEQPERTRFAKNLEMISSIEIVDPYTLRIELKHADPVFPLRLVGYQQGYIVSKKAVEQYGNGFDWNPVGTGPFEFVEHLENEKIILKAYDGYWEGRPTIDEVHWFDVRDDGTKVAGLKHRALDIIYPHAVTPELLENVKGSGAIFDKRGPGTQWTLYLNTTEKPFDKIKIRQAFLAAIDREAIRAAIWPPSVSRLATSPLPPGYFGHVPVDMPEYSPERAKQLLAEAGYAEGFTLPSHVMTQSSEYPKIMALVQQQLKLVGIEFPLEEVGHSQYHKNIRENHNAIVLYNATRLTDGDVMLSSFFHSSQIPGPSTSGKGTNFSHYQNIDEIIDMARGEGNEKVRGLFYYEAQRRLMRDAVVLPLAEIPDMSLRNPKRVHSPFDPDLGEYALHYFYNYPEKLKLLK